MASCMVNAAANLIVKLMHDGVVGHSRSNKLAISPTVRSRSATPAATAGVCAKCLVDAAEVQCMK